MQFENVNTTNNKPAIKLIRFPRFPRFPRTKKKLIKRFKLKVGL